MRACCFTGPRPKKLYGYYETGLYKALIQEKLVPVIDRLINHGFDTFYTGGAQGFDQCAFLAVEYLKQHYPNIKNCLILPYDGYGVTGQWAEYGLFGRNYFRDNILSRADTVTYASESNSYTKDSLFLRNHKMVDISEVVVALYPDDTWMMASTSRGSGTAECMRYAKEHGRRILQMTEQDAKLLPKVQQPPAFDMLVYQDYLAQVFQYKPQPKDVAAYNFKLYCENIPEPYRGSLGSVCSTEKGFAFQGKNIPICTKTGMILSNKYDRLVIGQYGAFLEIDDADINHELVMVKPGQEYRINDEAYKDHVKYDWYTAKDGSDCKLYRQKKEVGYADYLPGKWYISPYETEQGRLPQKAVIPNREFFSIPDGILCKSADNAKLIAAIFPETKKQEVDSLKQIPYSKIAVAVIDPSDCNGSVKKLLQQTAIRPVYVSEVLWNGLEEDVKEQATVIPEIGNTKTPDLEPDR